MPLDHYVSQVHLRNFYSPNLGEKMFGIRKRDLFQFQCRSEDICRIKNGSTNEYLTHDRAIEDFLLGIEPNYNKSIAKLQNGEIDAECLYVIAGFVSYVISCSPAGMRIHSSMPKFAAEKTTTMLDAKGEFGQAPPELGGKSITELLETGGIQVKVDEKYPQAIGISNITGRLFNLGNFYWEILLNNYSDSPFFTSDFPIAIEYSNDSNVINRIIPLAPHLALRIIPNANINKEEAKKNFNQHRFSLNKLSRKKVANINKLIVQCAESLIFYNNDLPWVKKFAAKYCQYRIEPLVEEIKVANGSYCIFNQRISKAEDLDN
jgi:hypothetical protein